MSAAPNRYLLIGVLAIMVNLALFTGLPNMLPCERTKDDLEIVQSVDFLREQPKENPLIEEKPDEPPPEPPKEIPPPSRQLIANTMEPLNPSMPEFDFDVSPDMTMGIPVAAPVMGLSNVFNLEDLDQAPMGTIQMQPAYPYRARRLNLSGTVDVKFLVGADGRVSRISILKADPPGVFDQSVMQSLAAWRFTPGKIAGQAVNTWVTTTIVFRIEDL